MEFHLSYFKYYVLKDDAVKVLHSICQQIFKTQQWPQDWKRSVFFPILKKYNAKECSNYPTVALFSQVSKVMFKISRLYSTVYELRTSRYSSWIQKSQRNQRPNCQHLLDHRKKHEDSRKASTSASLIILKPLCRSQQTVGNS